MAAFANKRGGRRAEISMAHRAFEFHESGVFRLAKQGTDFEAQAFFCQGPAIREFGATSSGAGLALKMGENTVQMVRNPRTRGSFRGDENERGYWISDSVPASELVDFYVDGVKTAWRDIGQGGSKRGVTGDNVPVNARGQRLGTSDNYISQLHSNNDDEAHLSQLPVCVGDARKKFLVEFSAPIGEKVWSKVFESSVTIFAEQPDAEGLCGDPDMQAEIKQGPPRGDYGYLGRNGDKYKLRPEEILFTTKQIHELCQTCGMPMKGDLCGGVGAIKQSLQGKTSFAFCTHKGYDHTAAQEACQDMPHDWKKVCEVEQCATESDAKGLLHLERELQEWFNHEGWNRPRAQQKSLANCAAENKDCRSSKCCKTPGMKCYKKDGHWGQCLFPGGCTPNAVRQSDPARYRTPWACKVLDRDTR